MSKVLITGSADGLGREAAKQLVRGGHEVVLHARDEARAQQALADVPGAAAAIPGDLSSITSTRALADLINAAGVFDAIIHNAGIGYREPARRETEDGLEHVFQTNVLAPYLLTALVNRPARLIYLSSGLLRSGDPGLADLQWEHRRWDGYQAYCDSKLFDAVLAAAVARRWPDVLSNSVEPGWVRTKMGGQEAPGEIGPGAETQVWLATSSDALAQQSGRHFYHRRLRETPPAVADRGVQDGLLAACHELTGQVIADRARQRVRGEAVDDDRTAISIDLADRSPEIHWPDGYDPADADLFARNDITINRPVETVWRNLINARAWPKWYSNASDVVVNGPSQLLDAGVSFEWVTFGLPVTSTVAEFLPPTRIGWHGTSTGLHAYHTWLLAPAGEGTHVLMEEVGNGPAAQQLTRNNPGQMHRGHDLWNVSLKFLCET